MWAGGLRGSTWRLALGAVLMAPAGLSGQSDGTDLFSGLERIEIPVGELVFDGLAAGPRDGQLVLFLHGFPQTSLSFRSQLRAVGAAGYRAVAFDQRGYSPRARPKDYQAYAVRNLVADVLGVADALGAETFHLVGHDWGGAVVWVTAAVAPARVRSLTVLSTPHPAALTAQRADPHSDQARRSSYFDKFAAEGAEQEFLKDDAALLRSIYGDLDAEAVDAYLHALGDPEALRAALAWYRAAFGPTAGAPGGSPPAASSGSSAPSPPPSAPPVAVSTVYVFGTKDPAFSWEAAEGSARHVTGPYRLVALDGAGHWLPEERDGDVTRIVLGHLVERSGAPDGVEANLGRLRAAFSSALVDGDGEAVASAYGSDAVLLPPGREVRGRERIARYFTADRAYRQVAHSMIPEKVSIDGGTVTEIGVWSSTVQRPGQERETSTNRYLLVWRLEDGAWRIAYDMWHR